jgi:transposase
MKYYTGLDISMKTTFICVLNEHGKKTFEGVVDTDPDAIMAALRTTKLSMEKVAIESGSISHWLMRELIDRGLNMVCIDSRKMASVLAVNINKTDKNDARLIAEALRCGFYSEVAQKTQEHAESKILLSSRRTLKDTATKLKNTIRGHLKVFGIRLPMLSNEKFSQEVTKILEGKQEVVQCSLRALLESFENVNRELKKLEKHIEQLAKKDPDVILLRTIPGVGVITAFTFKTSIGDPKRFKSSRSVGAYFGMTPTQYSSGEAHRQGRISKRGSNEMRAVLNDAATAMLYRTKSWSKIKAWGLKLKTKKGHKKATMAVGRKFCTIMHRMLITREPFIYGAPREKTDLLKKAG